MNGLVFASYGFFTRVQLNHPNSTPTIAQIALAGAGTGIVCSYVTKFQKSKKKIQKSPALRRIITTPTELIKIRQQSLLTRTTARAVALQIVRESGLAGLYRGGVATALRDSGYGPYFAAVNNISSPSHHQTHLLFAQYEATCRYFASSTGETQLSWSALLLAGGIAGAGEPRPL